MSISTIYLSTSDSKSDLGVYGTYFTEINDANYFSGLSNIFATLSTGNSVFMLLNNLEMVHSTIAGLASLGVPVKFVVNGSVGNPEPMNRLFLAFINNENVVFINDLPNVLKSLTEGKSSGQRDHVGSGQTAFSNMKKLFANTERASDTQQKASIAANELSESTDDPDEADIL